MAFKDLVNKYSQSIDVRYDAQLLVSILGMMIARWQLTIVHAGLVFSPAS